MEGRGAPLHGMLPSADAGRLTLRLYRQTARMVDGAPGTSCGALHATLVDQPAGRVGTAKVEPELWAGRWEARTVLGDPSFCAGQHNHASLQIQMAKTGPAAEPPPPPTEAAHSVLLTSEPESPTANRQDEWGMLSREA